MSHPKPDLMQAIVRYYRSGHTLRETATRFGLSYQRVHQVITKYAPKEMRPPHIYERKRA